MLAKFYEHGYKISHNRRTDVYNSACPICREGGSWGKKERCYYVVDEGLIYCHNCGWSSKPYRWIRKVSGMTHNELIREVSEGDYGYDEIIDAPKKEELKKKIASLPEDSINLSDSTQIHFYKDNKIVQDVLKYIKDRRLDTAVNKPDAFYLSLKDYTHKNRLVIPFKDEKGKIIHYQSRKVFEWDEMGNYLSKEGSDKSLCGVDRVSVDCDTLFLFEGPIDSFFVENGLGVAGINKGEIMTLTPLQQEQLDSFKFFDVIWVLDSQWIDETARVKTKFLIDSGQKVFIWPKLQGEKFKDFNEMCMKLNLNRISPEFIKKNSSHGLAAITKYKLLFG